MVTGRARAEIRRFLRHSQRDEHLRFGRQLLEKAFAEGESAVQQTTQLLELLERYGEKALRGAVHEAIERNTPRASSVAFLLRQRHRTAPLPLDLSRHPQAQNLNVRPHDLETYDELAHNRDKKFKS